MLNLPEESKKQELEFPVQKIKSPEYPYMEDYEQDYLEKWLAKPANFNSLKANYAKPFQNGAKFVPICGDGNCFFSACSTSLTASADEPLGTPSKHNELR